jgi:NADH dehydrogenase
MAMILVVGSTGSLGGQIARGLLDKGRRVRILVRSNSDHHSLVYSGAVPSYGDLNDRPSVDVACRDVDTVITTASALGRESGDTIEPVDLAGTRNLIEAAVAAGVRQFVFTSVLGATPEDAKPNVAATAASEAFLRSSPMSWTILAPNALMDVWLQAAVARPALGDQEVVYVGSGARRHSFVHSRDVAAFALAVLDHPKAAHRYLPIGGPRPISILDTIEVFERLVGHAIPRRGVKPGDPIPGLTPSMAEGLATLDTYDSPIEMAATADEFGVRLTPVETWAADLVPVGVA